MSKMRIYELAKKLELATKEVMEKIKELNLDYKSHMAVISEKDIQTIESIYRKKPKKELQTKKDKVADKPAAKKKEAAKTSKEKKAPAPKGEGKKAKKGKQAKKGQDQEAGKKEEAQQAAPAGIEIPASLTVADFSDRIGISLSQVITKLISYGVMANQNQEIDFETALLIADEFGKTVVAEEIEEVNEEDLFSLDFEDAEEDLVKRPPVVTIMGHVDHGKTSILDRIRETHVASGEAGGITQHIGAYTARVGDEKVVFLDTPGHEAFTTMRARGAQVTDIAILVVAGDDGVMPQTIEAISHAKAAGVPIIVAVNKMDRPEANLNRVLQELADNDLMPEDWGGDAIVVPVSAHTGQGIDDLLEMIVMVAEMEELKANPNRLAVGTVVEAQLDKGRGPTATVLVQKGTLRQGDEVFSGQAYGRVRALFNDNGKTIKKAGPSTPVLVLGLSEVPEAGDLLYAVDGEHNAKYYADQIKDRNRAASLKASDNISLDALFDKIGEGELKDLNIIIKTDVRGTIDAVEKSFEKLSNDEVSVNIIHGAVGGVTESDVLLANASKALIIGFNVRPTQSAIDLAKSEEVEIRTYSVIYEAIEDLKKAIEGMLEPDLVEEVQGRAEVRELFKISSIGTIAGVRVLNGLVTRNSKIRLLRNNIIVFDGPISSLKRYSDDVRELASGFEGGIGLENFNDIKEGDIMEAYTMKEVKRKL